LSNQYLFFFFSFSSMFGTKYGSLGAATQKLQIIWAER